MSQFNVFSHQGENTEATENPTLQWMRTLGKMVADVSKLQSVLSEETLECDETIRSHASNAQRLRKLSRHTASLVHFNVGGCHHSISDSTLSKHATSMLYHATKSPEAIRDSSGRILLDRDGELFGEVLNCMRGYRPQFTTHNAALLLEDLEYYGLINILEKLQNSHGGQGTLVRSRDHETHHRTCLRAAYCVGIVGETPLIQGKHGVSFRVKRGEYVGVGVVSDFCRAFNQEFHKTQHCCVYYMTGVFYSNYSHHVKEEGLDKFAAGDTLSIEIDMNSRIITFYKNESIIRIISSDHATRLRFASVMKFDSEVEIL
ncbi:BTB/POZ domain-containing protein KCTD7 [Perkinsela sp. CCAP 1560/4]|nr:BTB/POZ domain-containing protein KCTD7 [Perkinsela sp. CCAP 1560/4]|eukprot:KNH09398.1 BTB/POZ domain-containing protein KCTD7 [Perkinsela sp. CCAP 1560/4]